LVDVHFENLKCEIVNEETVVKQKRKRHAWLTKRCKERKRKKDMIRIIGLSFTSS
jgi:hypothetical protein